MLQQCFISENGIKQMSIVQHVLIIFILFKVSIAILKYLRKTINLGLIYP